MELPEIGEHCYNKSCNKLDFLPMKCDVCHHIFCSDHFKYAAHNCSEAYTKDNQVPVCPLCSRPVPVKRDELPDFVVGQHMDNDCQSDPAKKRRKVYTNCCDYKNCKKKELIPFTCNRCRQNFCVRHRLDLDHECQGVPVRKIPGFGFIRRNSNNQTSSKTSAQKLNKEDEDIKRAIALSMSENPSSNSRAQSIEKKQQEEADEDLARALAQSDMNTYELNTRRQNSNQSNKSCSVS